VGYVKGGPMNIRRIKELASRAQVEVQSVRQGGKHFKVRVVGKRQGIVIVSLSPSDKRVENNIISDMRRVTR